MDFEELLKALGLDNDESKEKAAILKKEYNASKKEINELTENVKKLTEDAEASKATAEKLDIVVKAFGLDIGAEDFDKNIQESKDKLVKDAGGGPEPEEVKQMKLDLNRTKRELDKSAKTIEELTTQLEGEKTQRLNNVKRTAIQKAVIKNNFIDPEVSIDLFINKATVDEDGVTVTMKGADGTDLPVADAIADWAKDHEGFIKKDVKGGMGSNGNNNGGGQTEVSPFMQNLIKQQSNGGAGGQQTKSLGEMFG